MLKKTKIDNYSLEEIIGKGQFSEIYLASKDQTTEKFVIKKYLREIVKNEDILRNMNNEIIILKNLNHPSIIKFKDRKKSKKAFYLIYEYCKGEIRSKTINDYIKNLIKNYLKKLFKI